MKLNDYVALSKLIQKVEDIIIDKCSLVKIYERYDDDGDKIYGRVISVTIN